MISPEKAWARATPAKFWITVSGSPAAPGIFSMTALSMTTRLTSLRSRLASTTTSNGLYEPRSR